MIASCVSLARIIVEIAVVARGAFAQLAPPLLAMLGLCVAIAAAMFFASAGKETQMPEQKNPAELKAAFIFGGLYALILLAVAVARERFGSAGLYTVGMLSGLTDVDAITLSTSRMAAAQRLEASLAWRTILIAVMSNFGFKLATVALLGRRALTARVACAFAAALAGGGAILWFWPSKA